MSILIIGAAGNMGRRYRAVLDYIGIQSAGVDIGHNRHYIKGLAEQSSGIIIATPTDTHAEYVRFLAECRKPILCEKPVTKDMVELKETLALVEEARCPFQMVMQYLELVKSPQASGPSEYRYWNHGRDGLIWDCIQIVGLANGSVELAEDSPIWRCRINGEQLNLRHMDRAYVDMVRNWMVEPGDDLGFIEAVHAKTDAYDRTVNHDRAQ